MRRMTFERLLVVIVTFVYVDQVMSSDDQERPAPSFSVELVQGKIDKLDRGDSVSPNDLKGKIVLVDFWATWCGPCKLASRHLNEIYSEYSKEGLIVLGVSDEATALVKSYLAKNSVDFPIAIDREKKIFQAFNVKSLPKVALIDRNGHLEWTGSPFHLTIENVGDYLKKGKLKLGKAQLPQSPAKERSAAGEPVPPILLLRIEPSQLKKGEHIRNHWLGRRRYLSGQGLEIAEVLQLVLGVTDCRFDCNDNITDERYNFEISYQRVLGDDRPDIITESLCRQFDLKLDKAEVKRDALVLQVMKPDKLIRRRNRMRWLDGDLYKMNATLNELAGQIEKSVNVPVIVGEESPRGIFEFSLPRDADLALFREALIKKYSIELESEERLIEVYKLSKK